jgi:hypothetical protein
MDSYDQPMGTGGVPNNGNRQERKSILDEFLESQSSSVVPETRNNIPKNNQSSRQASGSRPQSAMRSDGAKPPKSRSSQSGSQNQGAQERTLRKNSQTSRKSDSRVPESNSADAKNNSQQYPSQNQIG